MVDDATSTGTPCDAVASMVHYVLDDDDVAGTDTADLLLIFQVILCAFRI